MLPKPPIGLTSTAMAVSHRGGPLVPPMKPAPAWRRLPRIQPISDESAVLREQLDYIIGHTQEAGLCGCSDCQRYLRVRAALLEIFAENTKTPYPGSPKSS